MKTDFRKDFFVIKNESVIFEISFNVAQQR